MSMVLIFKGNRETALRGLGDLGTKLRTRAFNGY